MDNGRKRDLPFWRFVQGIAVNWATPKRSRRNAPRQCRFNKALWTLPGSMTKNKELHTVPLSEQVIDSLQSLPKIGDTFIFTIMGDQPFSGFGRSRDRIAEAAGVTD